MINVANWYIPSSLSHHLIRNNFFFLIINSAKFTSFCQLSAKPTFNTSTRILTTTSVNTNVTRLVKIFLETSSIQTTTIKFKGKGFKLIKNPTLLNLKFNFAHIQLFLSVKTLTLKTGKNKITLVNSNHLTLATTSFTLLKIRQTNIYTKNGLRLKRQILYRRKGKTLNS